MRHLPVFDGINWINQHHDIEGQVVGALPRQVDVGFRADVAIARDVAAGDKPTALPGDLLSPQSCIMLV